MNANPTQGEKLHEEFKQKREELKDSSKISILAKYGGEEYLQAAPKELRQGQTEDYVEYSRSGQVLKGRERAKAKSKYLEDGTCLSFSPCMYQTTFTVYINNHTAVWGSWYDTVSGSWGYACCHSTVHVSYCSGQAGIDAARTSSARHLLAISSVDPATQKRQGSQEMPDKTEQNYSKKRVGEGEINLDKERLKRAIDEEKKRKLKDGEDWPNKRRKDTIEGSSHEVTEEQLGESVNPMYPVSHVSQRHTVCNGA